VPFVVSTGRAHLNAIDGAALAPTELDWEALTAWQAGELAAFAGRYFLGGATQAEVDAGTGFCLWAHGEGSDPWVPLAIAPMQRADPTRSQADRGTAATYGADDALALATYVQRCLDVGELALPTGTPFVLVFLEVAAGTVVSPDYWLAWATTLHAAMLDPAPQSVSARQLVQPLLPAVACAFTRADEHSPYLPEQGVRDCLTLPAPPGQRNRCHGLWCTTPVDDPAFGELIQDQEPVPVCYWRTFDGPGGSAPPAGASAALARTLGLVTIDQHGLGAADATAQTLETVPWTAYERPIQCGVDTNKRLTAASAACVASATIVVRRLPSGNQGQDDGENLDADPIRKRGTFAFRYYSTRDGQPVNKKDLTHAEAVATSQAGLAIGVVWEAFAGSYRDIRDHFAAVGQGRLDAQNAFLYAAETIHQPAHTPVFFAIDFPPGRMYGRAPNDRWLMPSLDRVLDYFREVRLGFRDYLATHPADPYSVGIYAQADVCAAAYQAGLATHFWQPWPPTWGFNWEPFPHLNAWQIVLDSTKVVAPTPDLWSDNAAVQRCVNVDLDVAWGDPGTWQVFS